MPRFIDRLLAAKRWKTESFDLPATLFESAARLQARDALIRQDLHSVTVLAIDNVAQYYFQHHTCRDGRMDGPEQFPQLAPPFPSAFYEYTLEPSMYDVMFTEAERALPRAINQVGILVQSVDTGRFGDLFANWGEVLQEHRSDVPAKWVLFITVFAGHKDDREVRGPCTLLLLVVGEDGQATSRLRCRIWGIEDEQYDLIPEERLVAIGSMGSLAFPAFLATSFLHCRNVTTEENLPPAKLSKAHRRRHGQPLVRFKTLSIEPMKQVLRKLGRIENHGLSQALHLCRGHFKDYRNSSGLFGKHKGLFWWDMHARGALDQGAVVKDYAIKLPESGDSLEHR
ncbi:MAG TPA: hypothetical protein VE999_13635 [Gemmataceae bacterium]|nr:hypothetical protein [Bryobacteraceae bacterium]HZV06114.1 hypothetical protein [Gemmataceae bacterium]